MLDATPHSDRRGGFRQRVLKKALVVFNNGHSSVGCHMLDISEVGAKLLPTDVASCPREFSLKSLTGEPRQCEVIWRRGGVLGVRFLGPDQPEKTAEDRRRHARRRALQQALIVYNRGLSTMVCQVFDISELGAKLILADAFTCPREFVLKPRNGGPRQCAVLWRRGTTMGVRFF